MHGCDHEIKFGQKRIVKIQASIAQNIDLDSLQYPNARHLSGNPVDLVPLRTHAVFGQPMGIGGGLAVIANADVGMAQCFCGPRHGLDAVPPVAIGRVDVKRALEIRSCDQLGQWASCGALDLASALAQFRGDIVQSQRGEQCFLVGAVRAFIALKQSGFSELHPPILCPLSHRGVVFLAARKMVQYMWKGRILRDSQLCAHARIQHEARFGFAAARHLFRAGVLAECLGEFLPVFRARDDNDILGRFRTSAHVARDSQPRHPRLLGQVRAQCLGFGLCGVAQELPAVLLQKGHAAQNALRGFFAKAAQFFDFASLARLSECIHVGNAELFVNRPHPLRAQAGHSGHLEQPLGQGLAQLVQARQLAGFDHGFDHAPDLAADGAHGFQFAARAQVRSGFLQLVNLPRCSGVQLNAIRVFAVQFHQRGQVCQRVCNVFVGHSKPP